MALDPTVLDPACTPPAQRFPKLAGLIGYLQSIKGRADLSVLDTLLRDLEVSRADFAPVCCFGAKSYKRNPIARSEWFELLALCWRSGHLTPIHDHRGSSCAFRVVEGAGTEIRYHKTPSGLVCPAQTVTMNPGYVCAAQDSDIHQVANFQQEGQDLITLHIYSPPIQKMSTYDFATSCGPEKADC